MAQAKAPRGSDGEVKDPTVEACQGGDDTCQLITSGELAAAPESEPTVVGEPTAMTSFTAGGRVHTGIGEAEVALEGSRLSTAALQQLSHGSSYTELADDAAEGAEQPAYATTTLDQFASPPAGPVQVRVGASPADALNPAATSSEAADVAVAADRGESSVMVDDNMYGLQTELSFGDALREAALRRSASMTARSSRLDQPVIPEEQAAVQQGTLPIPETQRSTVDTNQAAPSEGGCAKKAQGEWKAGERTDEGITFSTAPVTRRGSNRYSIHEPQATTGDAAAALYESTAMTAGELRFVPHGQGEIGYIFVSTHVVYLMPSF